MVERQNVLGVTLTESILRDWKNRCVLPKVNDFLQSGLSLHNFFKFILLHTQTKSQSSVTPSSIRDKSFVPLQTVDNEF